MIEEYELDLDCEIIDPFYQNETVESFAVQFFEKRKRKGATIKEGQHLMLDRTYYGAMMVETGQADAFISGLTTDYLTTLVPCLQIIGAEEGIERVAGMYIIRNKKGTFFLADTTVTIDPGVDELVNIIELVARTVRIFDFEPKIAVLSYSNFGSSKGEIPQKTTAAVRKARQKWPDLIIDGDIQANMALNRSLRHKTYPFSELDGHHVNTLVFKS